MQFALGYFDEDSCRVEPLNNPFKEKLLPMCPERTQRKGKACVLTKNVLAYFTKR